MAEDPLGRWLDRAENVRDLIAAGRDVAKALSDFWDLSRKYREENWAKVATKVGAILGQRDVSKRPDVPPPRIFLPLVEHASYEDDDGLQDLWAGLIANSLDPTQRQRQTRLFVNLLSALEPIDAAILKYSINRIHPGESITVTELASGTGFHKDEISLSLQNLERLGCLSSDDATVQYIVAESSKRPPRRKILGIELEFEIMPLAYELLTACEPLARPDWKQTTP